MEVLDLPDDILIDKGSKPKKPLNKNMVSGEKDVLPSGGGAFHDKKDSNSKNYNLGIGQKLKMNMKKKHS